MQCLGRLTSPAIVRLYSKVQRDSGKANDMYCAHALAGRSQLTMKEVLLSATFVFTTNALALSPWLQGDFHHHIVDEAGRANIPMGILVVCIVCCKAGTVKFYHIVQLYLYLQGNGLSLRALCARCTSGNNPVQRRRVLQSLPQCYERCISLLVYFCFTSFHCHKA